MNPNNPSDFVSVRLTQAGREFAGAGETLRLATAHSHYVFVGAEPQKVLRRGEMQMFLAYHQSGDEPLFELAGNDSKTDEVAPNVQ